MSRKTVLILGIVLALGLIGLTSVFLMGKDYTYRGVLYQNPQQAPEFVLHSKKGTFSLADQREKVVLLFFGYTSCPDVCPSSLSDMKQVVSELDGWEGRLEVVFITVDPERDTVDKLDSYVSLFNTDFIGLSGSLEELIPIWDSYGVVREVDRETESMAGYLINHTARIYLVDQEGRLLLTYGFGTPPEEIRDDVEYLLGDYK